MFAEDAAEPSLLGRLLSCICCCARARAASLSAGDLGEPLLSPQHKASCGLYDEDEFRDELDELLGEQRWAPAPEPAPPEPAPAQAPWSSFLTPARPARPAPDPATQSEARPFRGVGVSGGLVASSKILRSDKVIVFEYDYS